VPGASSGFITANGPAAVAVGRAHVYWTNFKTGTIGRADLQA